jgi:hypothetical protein
VILTALVKKSPAMQLPLHACGQYPFLRVGWREICLSGFDEGRVGRNIRSPSLRLYPASGVQYGARAPGLDTYLS